MTTSPEVREGVDLKSLSPGSLIDMETKNRHYRIEYLGGTTMRISGHRHFAQVPYWRSCKALSTARAFAR